MRHSQHSLEGDYMGLQEMQIYIYIYRAAKLYTQSFDHISHGEYRDSTTSRTFGVLDPQLQSSASKYFMRPCGKLGLGPWAPSFWSHGVHVANEKNPA